MINQILENFIKAEQPKKMAVVLAPWDLVRPRLDLIPKIVTKLLKAKLMPLATQKRLVMVVKKAILILNM